jgi:hypothetical protein
MHAGNELHSSACQQYNSAHYFLIVHDGVMLSEKYSITRTALATQCASES